MNIENTNHTRGIARGSMKRNSPDYATCNQYDVVDFLPRKTKVTFRSKGNIKGYLNRYRNVTRNPEPFNEDAVEPQLPADYKPKHVTARDYLLQLNIAHRGAVAARNLRKNEG